MPVHNRNLVLEGVTRQAGDYIFRNQKKIVQVHYKKDSQKSAATNIDIAAERMITRGIQRLFPHDTIIGEELGVTQGSSEYKWIIDPIDGTANYILSLPFYSTTVALLKGDQIIAGTVYDPTRRELFFAQRNKGAFLSGKKVRLRGAGTLGEGTVSFSSTDSKKGIQVFSRVAPRIYKPRYLGSTALSLAYVGCDRLQGCILYGVQSWDAAAGALFVEEAGGIARTFDRHSLHLRPQQKMNLIVGRVGIVNILSGLLKKIPSA